MCINPQLSKLSVGWHNVGVYLLYYAVPRKCICCCRTGGSARVRITYCWCHARLSSHSSLRWYYNVPSGTSCLCGRLQLQDFWCWRWVRSLRSFVRECSGRAPVRHKSSPRACMYWGQCTNVCSIEILICHSLRLLKSWVRLSLGARHVPAWVSSQMMVCWLRRPLLYILLSYGEGYWLGRQVRL